MIADKLVKLVRARPFIPVRVHMKDGTAFDIKKPTGVLVSRITLEIGRNPDADGIFDGADLYHVPYITRVEQLKSPRAKK